MKKIFFLIVFLTQSGFLFSQGGKIFTMSNRVIECSYIKNKRFGVEYIQTTSTDGTRDYLAHSKIDRVEYENGDIEYISGSADKDHKNRTRKDPKDFTYLNLSYVSFNVGPVFTFPNILDYSTDYTGNGNGGAFTGFQTSIDAAFSPDIFSGVSLVGSVGYAYNPFEANPMINTLVTQLPSNSTNLKLQAEGWNNAHFMIGIGYYFDVTNRFILEARTMIGGLYSNHPSVTALYDTVGIAQKTTLSSEDSFFAVSGQISARYYITRKLSIRAGFNFFSASGNFSQLTRRDYVNSQLVNESNISGPGNANIEWAGIIFGIGYTIGK